MRPNTVIAGEILEQAQEPTLLACAELCAAYQGADEHVKCDSFNYCDVKVQLGWVVALRSGALGQQVRLAAAERPSGPGCLGRAPLQQQCWELAGTTLP